MKANEIRQARPEDMARILEMGERFVAESPYRDLIVLDPERLKETIFHVATNPEGVILLSESGDRVTGMIALMIKDHPYSGQRMAYELVWWVDPESRGNGRRLLTAAEWWARDNGAVAMQMVAPDKRIGGLYEALGYKWVESSYQRSL